MRLMSASLVALLLTGCYGGNYRHIGATDPASQGARIRHVMAENAADAKARAGAAAEACTTYVALHPERPREVLDGVLGLRPAAGMNMDEIALVFPGCEVGARMAVAVSELAVAIEVDQGDDAVRFVEVRRWVYVDAKTGSQHQLVTTLVLRNGALVVL